MLNSKTHIFKSEVELNVDIKTCWDFFSNPQNLDKTMPDGHRFIPLQNINTIQQGTTITYKVKQGKWSPTLTWVSKITEYQLYTSFTDIQQSGPFAYWQHCHSFQETKNGCLVSDSITYKLPLGFLGRIVNALFIKHQLKSSFTHRTKYLLEYFK